MKYFLFDKAQKYVTRINTEYLIEAHYTEEINTAGQLEFTLPATMRLPENVFYVCVTDPDDETSYLMFKIVTEKVTDEKVTYTCIESAYDELASYTYIKDKRPTAIASAMLQMVLDGTRWSVGSCPEVSPKFCSFYYISALEAIQKIVNLWGFEVQFKVKIDGITNEIKQRNINLYTKLGKRTNKRFEYGSNLLSVTQANDSTGLYTALVGRGKGVQVSSGDTDTDPDGYGRRITFADVVWSTQSGNPLNKPAGQEYLEDPNATVAYGFPDGHPRIGFVTFQDCEDPNELIQLTYDKLQEVNHPQVQFSASIADVGSLDLGDTIAIVRHDIGIEYYTRVFKVVHDLLDSSNNTVELGDNIAGSNSITQQISNIQNNQSNVQNAIDTIVMNGADGNKLFFGTDFPANGTDGDIFYKTLENGGTEMYIYKDGGWQLVVSTEELDAVQKQVDEQTSQIQQAVDNANDAVSKANSLSTTVGTVEDTLQSVQKTVSETSEQLTGFKNDLDSNTSNLNEVKQSIAGMSDSISSAQDDIAAIQKQVNDNGADISEIKQTQSSITSSVATLQGETSQLKQTANELQTEVGNNSGDISTLKQTASELQNTVGNNSGDISQLKQTSQQIQVDLTNASGDISELKQTANQLSSTITNLSIGGNNLLNNTADFSNWQIGDNGGAIESGEQHNINTSVFHGWGDNGNAWAAAPNEVYLEAGKEYTFSALVWDNSSVASPSYNNNVVNLWFDNDQGAFSYQLTNKTNNTPQVYSVTFTVGTSGKYHGFKLIDSQSLLGGSLWSAQYMLQSGNKATAWQQSAEDNASQEDFSKLTQKVDQIQSTVSSNAGNISQLTQTANDIKTSVTNNTGNISQLTQSANELKSAVSDNKSTINIVQQKADTLTSTITNMQVGGDNLLNNTADFSNWQIGDNGGAIESGEQHNINTSVFHGWGDNGNAWAAAPNEVYLEAGKEYTFSALVWDNSSVASPSYNNNVVNLWFDNDQGAFSYQLTNKTNNTPQVYSVTFTVGTSGKYHGFKLIDSQSLLGGSLWSAQYMLQSGNKSTSWQQSAADNASKADIVQLKETINGIQTTVSSQNSDISQLTQTAQSFQSTISSAVGPYVQNASFRDNNIQKYWSPWDTTTDYTNITYDGHHPDGYPASMCLHIQPNGTTKAITTDYIRIDPSSDIVVSLQNACGWSGNKPQAWLYVHFYDNDKNEVGTGNCELNIQSSMSWTETKGTWTADGSDYYIRVEVVLTGTSEAWLYVTGFEIASGNNGITSQISQLADDINLRVQKGDLLSQINIQAGSTLIQSNKLYLDASSVVFSGSAFIPSAAITDLSADKITTGTLNAANVHVINMDIANLVGDKTSFVRSQWQNAYGAYVNIEGSGMSIGYGNWFTKFDSIGMTFTDSGDDLGGFTRVGMSGAPSWYGGLGINAGGDAEFLAIGAKDYHNDNQNPIPAKLLWARQGIDTYGYHPGWNFGDDVWTSKIGINSIQYGDWNIKFGIVVGSNNFSALTLTSGSGDGFYWGSDGSFGYVTGGNALHNVKGSQIVYSIGSDGTCHSWGGV